MSIRRAQKSSIAVAGKKGSSFIAGYGPGVDEMDLIQRVTVGAGGQAALDFTSIPQTYQHLQLRYTVRSARASNTRDNMVLRVGNGSVDAGSNYAHHFIEGLGASVGAGGTASASYALLPYAPGSSATASVFGAGIVDILDYTSTAKTKVTRAVGGVDNNGDQFVGVDIFSGLWNSTSAINVLSLYAINANLVQYSTAALYGVKA